MREGGVSYRVRRESGSRRVVFDVSREIAADVEPHVSGEFSADGTQTVWLPGPDVDVPARAKELARRFGQRVVTRERTD
jgi:hypothetical protein